MRVLIGENELWPVLAPYRSRTGYDKLDTADVPVATLMRWRGVWNDFLGMQQELAALRGTGGVPEKGVEMPSGFADLLREAL